MANATVVEAVSTAELLPFEELQMLAKNFEDEYFECEHLHREWRQKMDAARKIGPDADSGFDLDALRGEVFKALDAAALFEIELSVYAENDDRIHADVRYVLWRSLVRAILRARHNKLGWLALSYLVPALYHAQRDVMRDVVEYLHQHPERKKGMVT